MGRGEGSVPSVVVSREANRRSAYEGRVEKFEPQICPYVHSETIPATHISRAECILYGLYRELRARVHFANRTSRL